LFKAFAEKYRPGQSALETLHACGLMEGRNGQAVPTMASLMLFGRNPLRWHERCGIDFVRWEGKERKSGAELNISKRFSVEAPLSALIERAFDSIKPFIRERQNFMIYFSAKSLNIQPSLGRKPSSTRLLTETTVSAGLASKCGCLKTAWKSVARDCHPALLLWRHWPNVSIYTVRGIPLLCES